MTAYVVTEPAQNDIEDVAERISRDDPRMAQRFLDDVYASFALLAMQPGLGHRRPDLTARAVFFWPVMKRSFAVIYRKSTPLQIIRVVRWRRNIAALPLYP